MFKNFKSPIGRAALGESRAKNPDFHQIPANQPKE
jgi:hypothetical protein